MTNAAPAIASPGGAVQPGAAGPVSPGHFADAAHNARNSTATSSAAPRQTPAHPPLGPALDKVATWTHGMQNVRNTLADTVAHPQQSGMFGKPADMGDAQISLNRMDIHLTKLQNLEGEARGDTFKTMPTADQQKLLQSIDGEMHHVRDFAATANQQSGAANRAVSDGDAAKAQIGMNVTKAVTDTVPTIAGAAVEARTGNKAAGDATKAGFKIVERLFSEASNTAIGGSPETMNKELGSVEKVCTEAAIDAVKGTALKSLHLPEGLQSKLGDVAAAAVKGGAGAAVQAHHDGLSPEKAREAVLAGARNEAMNEVAKMFGGAEKLKDNPQAQKLVNIAAGAANGGLQNVLKGEDFGAGALAGANKAAMTGDAKAAGKGLGGMIPKAE